MGIVLKQSLNNTLITYIGFAIGALNTLFLYTHFMDPKYYGLIQVVLSAATVLSPILAFGVPNALIKYYSGFEKENEQNAFLSLMLFLPFILIIPLGVLSNVANDAIGNLLARKNTIVKDYVWHIFIIGMAIAYFEVFYAWARIRMKSVFGNFMKEVFCRAGQTILLILLVFEVITADQFILALVGFYVLRMVIMKLYAFNLRRPKLNFTLPENTRDILRYSALIIIGGSTAVVLLEVDKVMINNFIKIENVAYYSVAGFIATVIAVPSRSMHQITYPLTAEHLNNKDKSALKSLYQKSSLTLFIVSGLLFVLILLNLNDLYEMLPADYRGGFMIVFWIGLARVYDALLGNNNAILYNSEYYKAVLFMGVCLAFLAIFFNLWLIPKYGLDGAAIASFSAFFIYNTIKLFYVRKKFGIQPFTKETLKVVLLLLVICAVFFIVTLPFHPLINILLKSVLITTVFVGVLYRFRISDDVYGVLQKFLGNNE
ncbi:MAG: polysaccharide biosynthesis C-terminal domain-containing protein [Flavobacteriaceae bacterium]